MIEKIISGGQTGVDRAALDVAIDLGIPLGGWCPKGRIDELGVIPQKYYLLSEVSGDFRSEEENCAKRTKMNISDTDGTLIIVPTLPLPPEITDGTLLTITEAEAQGKPHLLLSLSADKSANISELLNWVEENNIRILNIAGPRESSAVGIYRDSFELLSTALCTLSPSPTTFAP